MAKPRAALPSNILKRGFSAMEAAEYVGLSVSAFRAQVEAKVLPAPRKFGRRLVWDRCELDAVFDGGRHDPERSDQEKLDERLGLL